MQRFSDEVGIISPIVWIIAGMLWAGLFCVLFFVALPSDHQMSQWPGAGRFAFSIWPGMLVAAVVLLAGYINADARRRGMRHVMWTLLALFLPNAIGVILYFVFRDPLLARCGKCGARGRANFAYCTQCGTQLSAACPACKRPVEPDWKSCPYCGNALGRSTPAA
jgi:hypothetical protein